MALHSSYDLYWYIWKSQVRLIIAQFSTVLTVYLMKYGAILSLDCRNRLRQDAQSSPNRRDGLGSEHIVCHHEHHRDEGYWTNERIQCLVDTCRHRCARCIVVGESAYSCRYFVTCWSIVSNLK